MSVALAEAGGGWFGGLGPGVFGDVPEEGYHASDGLSVSRLKRFVELPAKAFVPRKETASLRFGAITHSVLLMGEAATRASFLVCEAAPNTLAWKADKARAEAEGRTFETAANMDKALRVRDAVMGQRIGRELLEPGRHAVEQSFRWRDWETGLLCRGRADVVRPDWGCLADIKSCEDASEEAFANKVGEYGYDWQAIQYQDGFELAQLQSEGSGWRPRFMLFLAVEKEPPHFCHPMEVDAGALMETRVEVRDAMRRYKACQDAARFPAYPDTVTKVGVPQWARRERARHPAYHDPEQEASDA